MGPLAGIRVIELAGLGPAPFCAMLLADLDAEVIRVDRPLGSGITGLDRITCRNRRSLGLDLKKQAAREILFELLAEADVLIEGFRPGVVERLGIGPGECLARNPRLIYGRMTGWGQSGPLASRAGHDINYIALSGALDSIGDGDSGPIPPLNLVGDFGGGALYLAVGILAALVERAQSDAGQVVEAAMTDGAASLMTMFYELREKGFWRGERGDNLLDGGAPFYATYETADGGYVAVGALEPQFFDELVARLGIDRNDKPAQYDVSGWPELRRQLAAAFRSGTRDEWAELFMASDACVTPVLSMEEAPSHPHNAARRTFIEIDGFGQPAATPRFGRSSPVNPRGTPSVGEHTDEILADLGCDPERVAELRATGAVH